MVLVLQQPKNIYKLSSRRKFLRRGVEKEIIADLGDGFNVLDFWFIGTNCQIFDSIRYNRIPVEVQKYQKLSS